MSITAMVWLRRCVGLGFLALLTGLALTVAGANASAAGSILLGGVTLTILGGAMLSSESRKIPDGKLELALKAAWDDIKAPVEGIGALAWGVVKVAANIAVLAGVCWLLVSAVRWLWTHPLF